MYHIIQDCGLCLYCGRWCEYCNQCKCEIKLKKICPGFDVKADPERFLKWKAELELERLAGAEMGIRKAYGIVTRRHAEYLAKRRRELRAEIDGGDEVLYSRRDTDGLAYYDR